MHGLGTVIPTPYRYGALQGLAIPVLCIGCSIPSLRDGLKQYRQQNTPPTEPAPFVLDLIGTLYKLERSLKGAVDSERCSMWQRYAVPVLDDIFSWCRAHREKFLPKAPLRGAIQYALNHEVVLRRYCEDGRLSIDNNAAERALNEFDYLCDVLDRLSDLSRQAELQGLLPDMGEKEA